VPAIAQSQLSFAIDEISQPFAVPALTPLPPVPTPASNPLPAILFGIWLCGVTIGIGFWVRWWRQMRAVQRAAAPLDLNLPIQVMSSPARMEPGVVGIFKPVLLLPEAITEHLTPPQVEAILAHELRHVHRRDNLTAGIHMLVETIFWFHPLVWWIRARLMEERERACDEDLMRMGLEPQVYAESILRVCEFYLASPLACASGVTGGELKRRIERIMANQFARNLSYGKKILLASAAMLAVAGPAVIGLTNPTRGRAQSVPAFEVASVKLTPLPEDGHYAIGYRFTANEFQATYVTMRQCIAAAYDVTSNDLITGPAWITSDSARYSITAKAAAASPESALRLMLQGLLAERFQLKIHKETQERPVYALVVAKNGLKLKAVPYEGADRDYGFRPRTTGLEVKHTSMAILAKALSTGPIGFDRPVVDKTGVDGLFDFNLRYATRGFQPVLDPPEDATEPTIFAAFEDIGLRLEPRKGPVECIVIDSVMRVPTEN
jgi:uncharacterized protein (TIGR03435 family)